MARDGFRVKKSLNIAPRPDEPTQEVQDGDVYYDSTLNELRARIDGEWVALGGDSGFARTFMLDD